VHFCSIDETQDSIEDAESAIRRDGSRLIFGQNVWAIPPTGITRVGNIVLRGRATLNIGNGACAIKFYKFVQWFLPAELKCRFKRVQDSD